ncbi:cytochrome P450 [Aulographum hederae CBS 113979]|uniref:Cytochrome P450 n=1 Tax=Aulographum hederae CBS 113979 TaxID=1176131 RepID=A0A6G1GUZ8_9PEZI|nr:cytochrome P450 [Aulographum hederae CBS 113979]
MASPAIFPLNAPNIDTSPAVTSNDSIQIYNSYDELRQTCPLASTSHYNGFWLLTRHADIKSAALNSSLFISSRGAVIPSDPRGIRRPPLNYDPPAHTPYRTALDRTLKPNRLKRLETVLRKHARDELAPLLEKGTGDICTQFGAKYSAWVETEWLNLSPETAPALAETAAAWVNAWREQKREVVNAQSEKLYSIARALFADRKARPRDVEEDPASSLLAERLDGEPLDEEQLIGGLRQSLVVGMVAPPILYGCICVHLAEDKELQKRLREDPKLTPKAIDEFVRLYTPYRGFARTVSEDVEIHGCTVSPGVKIALSYASANRDPGVFVRPDEFDMERENIRSHLGFGIGRHRCLGMPLAKLALQVALETILECTDDFEVNGPLDYARMPEMGVISCPLTLITLGKQQRLH